MNYTWLTAYFKEYRNGHFIPVILMGPEAYRIWRASDLCLFRFGDNVHRANESPETPVKAVGLFQNTFVYLDKTLPPRSVRMNDYLGNWEERELPE